MQLSTWCASVVIVCAVLLSGINACKRVKNGQTNESYNQWWEPEQSTDFSFSNAFPNSEQNIQNLFQEYQRKEFSINKIKDLNAQANSEIMFEYFSDALNMSQQQIFSDFDTLQFLTKVFHLYFIPYQLESFHGCIDIDELDQHFFHKFKPYNFASPLNILPYNADYQGFIDQFCEYQQLFMSLHRPPSVYEIPYFEHDSVLNMKYQNNHPYISQFKFQIQPTKKDVFQNQQKQQAQIKQFDVKSFETSKDLCSDSSQSSFVYAPHNQFSSYWQKICQLGQHGKGLRYSHQCNVISYNLKKDNKNYCLLHFTVIPYYAGVRYHHFTSQSCSIFRQIEISSISCVLSRFYPEYQKQFAFPYFDFIFLAIVFLITYASHSMEAHSIVQDIPVFILFVASFISSSVPFNPIFSVLICTKLNKSHALSFIALMMLATLIQSYITVNSVVLCFFLVVLKQLFLYSSQEKRYFKCEYFRCQIALLLLIYQYVPYLKDYYHDAYLLLKTPRILLDINSLIPQNIWLTFFIENRQMPGYVQGIDIILHVSSTICSVILWFYFVLKDFSTWKTLKFDLFELIVNFFCPFKQLFIQALLLNSVLDVLLNTIHVILVMSVFGFNVIHIVAGFILAGVFHQIRFKDFDKIFKDTFINVQTSLNKGCLDFKRFLSNNHVFIFNQSGHATGTIVQLGGEFYLSTVGHALKHGSKFQINQIFDSILEIDNSYYMRTEGEQNYTREDDGILLIKLRKEVQPQKYLKIQSNCVDKYLRKKNRDESIKAYADFQAYQEESVTTSKSIAFNANSPNHIFFKDFKDPRPGYSGGPILDNENELICLLAGTISQFDSQAIYGFILGDDLRLYDKVKVEYTTKLSRQMKYRLSHLSLDSFSLKNLSPRKFFQRNQHKNSLDLPSTDLITFKHQRNQYIRDLINNQHSDKTQQEKKQQVDCKIKDIDSIQVQSQQKLEVQQQSDKEQNQNTIVLTDSKLDTKSTLFDESYKQFFKDIMTEMTQLFKLQSDQNYTQYEYQSKHNKKQNNNKSFNNYTYKQNNKNQRSSSPIRNVDNNKVSNIQKNGNQLKLDPDPKADQLPTNAVNQNRILDQNSLSFNAQK